jgi:hypothetical protein
LTTHVRKILSKKDLWESEKKTRNPTKSIPFGCEFLGQNVTFYVSPVILSYYTKKVLDLLSEQLEVIDIYGGPGSTKSSRLRHDLRKEHRLWLSRPYGKKVSKQ